MCPVMLFTRAIYPAFSIMTNGGTGIGPKVQEIFVFFLRARRAPRYDPAGSPVVSLATWEQKSPEYPAPSAPTAPAACPAAPPAATGQLCCPARAHPRCLPRGHSNPESRDRADR